MNEQELRAKILKDVEEYYHLKHTKKPFTAGEDQVHYAGRFFDHEELVNLVDSSLDFWLTAGRYYKQFESELAEKVGCKFSVFVNSGSSANLLAFATLTSPLLGDRQIQRGDEVITVAAGFPTTVAPMVQYGAVPVFVDVDIPTYNIDVNKLNDCLTPKTKAVMVAHTLGNPFDIQAVKAFCDANNLWLVEDNCDALGSTYDGQFTGSYGDLSTYSFYPAHHITTGEGGAVATNNALLKKILDSVCNWGRDCWCPTGVDNTCKKRFDWQLGELPKGYDHKYTYSHFGYNLKATDMQAAIGCAQLKKLDAVIEGRQKNWQRLYDIFEPYSEYFILPEPTEKSKPSWFGFMLLVKEDAPFTRNDIVEYFEDHKVQTRMLFGGNIIKHPLFDHIRNDESAYRIVGELTNTDRIMTHGLWLGVFPGITEDMLQYIKATLEGVMNHVSVS